MLKTTNETNGLKDLKQLSEDGQIEGMLAKDPNLLRTLIDNLPDLIFVKDTESRFIISNLAVEQLLGAKTPDEFIGKTDFDVFPQELAAQYYADDQAVIRSGQPLLNREEPIIDLAGNRQWLSTTKVPLRDSHDHIIGLVGISRDITERKQAEEAHQRLAAILEATNDFVGMADTEGRVFYINQAGRKMVGIGETEDITTTHIPDYHPDWANEVIRGEGLPTAIQAGIWSGETVFLHRDGREIPVSQDLIAHKSADGIVEFFSTIARDITKRKQLEQQIGESLERRTHQVQTTTEIAQEIATTLALDDIFQRVVDLMQERFGYSHIHLYMLQDDYLVLQEGAGEAGRRMKEAGHKIALMAEKSLVARAARNGEPVLASDVFQEPDWLPNPLRPHTKAEIAVPIKFGTKVLGVLDVQSESVGGVSEEDQLLLMGLCGQIAVAINSRLAEAERRQMEVALQESEALFRATFEEAPVGMALTDMQGGVLVSNLAYQKMLGYSAEELRELASVAKFTHPDDVDETMRLLQELVSGERHGYQIEKRYIRQDGQVVWGRLTASLIRDEQGRPLFVVGMIEDITERRQAEDALRESEEKYRLVVDSVKEVIFQVDTAGCWTFLNPAWTEIMGFSVEECLATPYLNYIHSDDLPRHTELFQALLEGDIEYYRHASHFLTKEGGERWIEVYAQPTWAADGTILGMSGTLNDISDRKRAEQSLRASETRFRTLATHAPVGIFENDAQGDHTYVNKRWCDLTGMTLAESLGQGWIKALHPADRERVLTEWNTAAQSGQEFALEYRFQTPAGNVAWVFGNAVAVRDEAGEITGYLGTVTDITESKQVGELLAQRAAQLMLINDIGGKIAAVLDLDSVLDRAAYLVQNTFNYHHVALFLLDNDVARLKAIAGSYTAYFPSNHTQELDRGIIGWVATHSEKVVVNDVSQDPRYISKIADQTVTQAELCLPIKVAGQMIGVLDIQSPRLDAFGENDIILMEILVDQIAVAIENARLYQAVQLELAERKQVEDALAEERNLLRTLIDNIPDSIYVKDMESRFIIGNPAVAHHMGMTTFDELIGKTDFDFHPQVLAAQFYENEQMIFKSGQPLIDIEEYYVDPVSGSEGWILTTKVPLRDSQGQLLGLVGVGRDMTQRKQMEEALRQSEERFALAVQGSNDGIWDNDMVNNTVYWSPRLIELYGYDPNEFDPSYEQFESSLHPDDIERIKAAIEAHLKDRVPFDIEQRGRTKSGEYRWFRTRGQAVWDESGRPLRMVGSATDITEQKQMETALAEERNLLRTLIDNLPDSIYVKDTEGRHLIVNHAVIKGIGLATVEEMLGKTDLDLYPQEMASQWYADDMAVIQSGQPLINREEISLARNDGLGWDLTTKIPLYDGHGKVVGLVGVTRDITEQKRAALELQQAKEVAETATRVKSEFLANMSHEIRTPLNAVIGMTSLLLDTSLSSEQHDFAETIRTSGDTLLTVINDILDFSKIEAGKLELETQPFDLRQCIEESLDLVAINAAEKKLELAYLIDDSTPSALVGDVTRLRQILVNLLNNAVKFTEQGEIVLSVRSHLLKPKRAETQESQDQDTQSPPPLYEVHVVVRDTGIGIPPDRLDRLFRSFSQVDASTTRKYGGTGLGLTISKRLSELMGGGMWVESEGVPGQGSIFHFTLLAQAGPSQPRIYLRGKNPELTGKHLLIVDDNATNRLILARQAQAWGMRPRAAAAAEEALAWIRRGDSFDLAILDMQMPVMDGLTLAVEIRKYRTAQTLPLVMLTSLGQREDNDQTSQVEFAAFLTKPIKPSHLYNILSGIFEDQPVKIKPDSPRSSLLDHELGQRHPLRILLAEDNAVNQKVALYLLERLSYSADVAANGLEVLEALQRQPYDVVLMDVQMPEMDGLEATQHILAQWPAAQRPWIIAMTANALQGDRERCLAAGMNDYISKPVRPEELTRALSQSQPRTGRIKVELSTEPEVSAARNKNATQVTQSIPVLEAGVLAELRELLGEHAPQMIAELIDLFFETARPLLEEMRTAVRKEDGLGLRRAAHTIKPGSAHLGAVRLADLGEELETMGETGQLDGAAAKLAEFEAEFSRVKIALEAEKRGSNG